MGVPRMFRVGRDGHDIDDRLRALTGKEHLNGHPALSLGRPVARLDQIAAIAVRHADIAVGEVVDIGRRVEISDEGPDLLDQCRRPVEVGALLGRRIDTEIGEGRRKYLVGIVEQRYSAGGELLRPGGIENQRPAAGWRAGRRRRHPGDIIPDAGAGDHVGHGMRIAGVGRGQRLQDRRGEVFPVRQEGAVELAIDARFHLAGDKGRNRGKDNVVPGPAGHQLGFENLVGIVNVVIDLDAGLGGKAGQRILGDIVGPVIDVEGFFLGGPCGTGNRHQRREDDTCGKPAHRATLSADRNPYRAIADGEAGNRQEISRQPAFLSTDSVAGGEKIEGRLARSSCASRSLVAGARTGRHGKGRGLPGQASQTARGGRVASGPIRPDRIDPRS